MSEDVASPEQTAQLRGQALVWQMVLHQSAAHLSDLAAHPHGSMRRMALEVASEHIRSAEMRCSASTTSLTPRWARPGARCRRGTCRTAWSGTGTRCGRQADMPSSDGCNLRGGSTGGPERLA